VVIILGVVALIGYTLDLAAIAGIIATVGTSVDAQVMLVDELLAGAQVYTLKQRVKRAFFMIFGSAATVLAAMLPLAIIGLCLTVVGGLTEELARSLTQSPKASTQK
jgi:preprotein translocase subunit SecD